MKKIFFSLLALIGTISMNAQVLNVMKLMKGNTVVATYYSHEADRVEIEKIKTTGTAKRTGDIDVNWVQLWENGPKFAEYNVGAANNKAEDYGGYYVWGGSQDKVDDHNTGTDALTGDADTATKLWGDNWRMPTSGEFWALLDNCDVAWTYVNGVNGRKFTGKGDYASNSVFLPAAGYFSNGRVYQGPWGHYWSSTPYRYNSHTYRLGFGPGYQNVRDDERREGFSVRAVLKEN